MRSNLEGKEVKEEAASFSIYWMGEGANFEIGTGGSGGTLGAPHRLICGGTADRRASATADAALPLIWRGEVRREVRVDELKRLVYGGDDEAEKKLAALLRSYEIPEEYAREVGRRLRGLVREEVRRRDLPEEEWLVEALYRILVYMAHAALCTAEA